MPNQPLESHIESRFAAVVDMLGGKTRKLVYAGRRGATDRLVLFPGKHCVVELKRSPKEQPRINQIREHNELRQAGFEVFVLSSLDEVDRWVEEWIERKDDV